MVDMVEMYMDLMMVKACMILTMLGKYIKTGMVEIGMVEQMKLGKGNTERPTKYLKTKIKNILDCRESLTMVKI